MKSPETAVHGTTASFITTLLSVRFHVVASSSFVNSHTTVSHAPIVRSDPLNAVAFPVHVSPV